MEIKIHSLILFTSPLTGFIFDYLIISNIENSIFAWILNNTKYYACNHIRRAFPSGRKKRTAH